MKNKIEMNHQIVKGEEYQKDYSKLVNQMLTSLGYEDATQINTYGNIMNLVCVFDSETSNYVDSEGEKRPFIISEAMNFLNLNNNKNFNILFRNVLEFKNFLNSLSYSLHLKVSTKQKTNKDGHPVFDKFNQPVYDSANDVYLPIYVHNLPFDASFLLPVLDAHTVFSASLHKPYYFITKNGFKFIDTAVLTQDNLAGLGHKLRLFHVEKKIGDFDYNVIRTPKTKFTDKELGYVLNDVLVLSAYVTEYVKNNYAGVLANLPMTQTGIVRDFLNQAANGSWPTWKALLSDKIITEELFKQSAQQVLTQSSTIAVKTWNKIHHKLSLATKINYFYDSFNDGQFQKSSDKRNNADLNSKVLHLILLDLGQASHYHYTLHDFELMKKAYHGGFTHSNAEHTGKILKNVHSFDFTSSYPTRILSQKFANNNPIKMTPKELDNLDYLVKKSIARDQTLNNLYIFTVTVDKLNLKSNVADGYLPDYDTKADRKYSSNGRIISGVNVEFTTTSIDWAIIRKVYNLKGVTFTDGIKMHQSYLPRFMVASTIYFYANKTKLKHVEGREADYMRSKQMLNSTYGCCVRDLVKPAVFYENHQWSKYDYYKDYNENNNLHSLNITQKILESTQKKSPLFYVWGVEISAYARVALWRGILAVKSDYVYSDTDSLKLVNWKRHLSEIDKENKLIVNQINQCLTYKGIDPKLSNPVDIKGKHHQLGVWDFADGDYTYFKTLGAKRYIDLDDAGKFEITVAGLSKKKGSAFILKASKAEINHRLGDNYVKLDEKNVKKLFDFFNNKMYVPADSTGKLASYYVDHYNKFKINDVTIPGGGGCLLSPVDFTMSMAVSFESILKMLSDGYNFSDKFTV